MTLFSSDASSSPIPDPQTSTTSTTCTTKGITASRAQAVAAAFSSAKLTPQAITSGIQPKVEVNVAYGSKAVTLGNTFFITETPFRPTITFTAETDQDPATTKYFIFMVDPDAPSPTDSGAPASLSFALHQATYDCSPNCINSSNNGGGKDFLTPGYRSAAPASVALHRYTQLVYRQPAGWKPPAGILASLKLTNFDLNGFVAKNGFVLVGGNYFLEGI